MLAINNQFISQTFYVALGRIHYAQPVQPHKNILQASTSSYLIENNVTNITNNQFSINKQFLRSAKLSTKFQMLMKCISSQ